MDVPERIEHFSFWQPVAFTSTDNPGITDSAKWSYYLGSLADQYASLNTSTLHVNAERMNARKIYFEKGKEETPSLFITAMKVGSYILSLGILPVIALAIKYIFKKHLNECLTMTKNSENEVFYEKEFGKTKIVLLYGSITDETTDAIVNAANAGLKGAGSAGVCGAIYDAAGEEPFDECKEILADQERGHLDCGKAVLTSAGELAKIKAIVHAVGPDYRLKAEEEKGKDLLSSAYYNSLAVGYQKAGGADFISKKMQGKKIHSIAFPSISTGIFKAPLEEAAPVALETVRDFIKENPNAYEEVRFVLRPLALEPDTGPAYQKALENLK